MSKSVKVYNLQGQAVDFDGAANLMDPEIREAMHDEIDWSPEAIKTWTGATPEQAFFDNYCGRHAEKFGKPFEVN